MLIRPMLTDSDAIRAYGASKQERSTLHERIDSDAKRDPLDALKDAETLRTLHKHLLPYLSGPAPDVALRDILLHLIDVARDPVTSHVLLGRIREDLAAGDIDLALAVAQELVQTNGRRADAALSPPC